MARPTLTAARSTGLVGVIVAGAAVIGVLFGQMPGASASNAASWITAGRGGARPTLVSPPTSPTSPTPPPSPTASAARPGPPGAALGEADGIIPAGTTVFDDDVPGVANLDPALLGALRKAATDARRDGIRFLVDSGWRSPAYQAELLREAVSTYGSEEEAVRWVATPATSPHVSGDAIDLGPAAARTWLAKHGAAYGLCQIYRNEPWHFELREAAEARRCPRMYADPTHDPRMDA